jgi:hypothetical protein
MTEELIQIVRQICNDVANVPDECDYDHWGEFYSQMLANIQDVHALFTKHGMVMRIGDKQKDMAVIPFGDL